MNDSTVYVGIDYATAFVQVCVLDRSGRQLGNARCPNDSSAIVRFVTGRGKYVRAAIEACNGAADLAEELHLAGWSIDLAHPGYVARMKRGPDKTDFTDARMLGDLVRVGYLPRVWLAPQCIRELRRLVRYRWDLVKRRCALKLRIRALLRDHRCRPPAGVHAWTIRWAAWLDELSLPAESTWILEQTFKELREVQSHIHEAESRLHAVTREDPYVQHLERITGIGLVTACAIRAEVGDPARFRNGKQLARFCGLTPRNASSGERQADAGLIRAGNRVLRGILIEAAHRLKRFDPRWRSLAATLRAKGKPGSVIAAAVANRWMRGLHHELLTLRKAA
jgi:transposase